MLARKLRRAWLCLPCASQPTGFLLTDLQHVCFSNTNMTHILIAGSEQEPFGFNISSNTKMYNLLCHASVAVGLKVLWKRSQTSPQQDGSERADSHAFLCSEATIDNCKQLFFFSPFQTLKHKTSKLWWHSHIAWSCCSHSVVLTVFFSSFTTELTNVQMGWRHKDDLQNSPNFQS